MPREKPAPGVRVSKLLWFLGLWVGGVVVMALVAWALRALIAGS
jgi:hypothetical protein